MNAICLLLRVFANLRPVVGVALIAGMVLVTRPAVARYADLPGGQIPPDGGGRSIPIPEFQRDLQNVVVSSNPTTFTGIDINGFLGADRFYSNGNTGQNTVTSNIEAGHVWGDTGTTSGHETLNHVTNFIQDAGAFGATADDLIDRHATWVGTIIGGGPAGGDDWKVGIAPDTDLRSGGISAGWVGTAFSGNFNMTTDTFLTPYNSAFGSSHVINSSWGGGGDPGAMNGFATALDGWARQNPSTSFVVAAGNDGPAVNSLIWPGAGYNAITVGALGNANNYDTVASFSSRGPQDYWDPFNGTVAAARAAVDISAPGQTLTSAFYGDQSGGNHPALPGSPSGVPFPGGPADYSSSIQGTSFASPMVAGGAALINSASLNTFAANPQSRDSRVVKAVLLNSADKTSGWNNGQIVHPNGLGGVLTEQSLDWDTGAGRMNLDTAYDQYLPPVAGTTDVLGTDGGNIGPIGWDYGIVEPGMPNDYLIDVPLEEGTTFTVTLAWLRDRGVIVNPPTANDNGQTDLDLHVFDATGGLVGSIISSSESTWNDVEHLHFTVPRTGMYGIQVEYFGNLFGAQTAEPFGLAWHTVPVPEPSSVFLAACGLLTCFLLPVRRPRRGQVAF